MKKMKSHLSLKLLFTLPALLVWLLSPSASAADGGHFFFDESFFPAMGTKTDTDSTATSPGVAPEVNSGIDSRTTLGFVFSPQILVGMTYNYYSSTTNRVAVSGGSDSLQESISKTEYGPTVGYLYNGWRFLATYFLKGTQAKETINKGTDGTQNGNTLVTQNDLKGFQAVIGYTYAFNNYFSLGSSVIYRSVTYATQERINRLNPNDTSESYGATTLFTAKAESSLTPMLSMELRF
jgi:hypothetical protein